MLDEREAFERARGLSADAYKAGNRAYKEEMARTKIRDLLLAVVIALPLFALGYWAEGHRSSRGSTPAPNPVPRALASPDPSIVISLIGGCVYYGVGAVMLYGAVRARRSRRIQRSQRRL